MTNEERRAAAIAGCDAVIYMSKRLGEHFECWKKLTLICPADEIDMMLEEVDAPMQMLGDYLNAVDAVTEQDEEATDAAFKAMPLALGKERVAP